MCFLGVYIIYYTKHSKKNACDVPIVSSTSKLVNKGYTVYTKVKIGGTVTMYWFYKNHVWTYLLGTVSHVRWPLGIWWLATFGCKFHHMTFRGHSPLVINHPRRVYSWFLLLDLASPNQLFDPKHSNWRFLGTCDCSVQTNWGFLRTYGAWQDCLPPTKNKWVFPKIGLPKNGWVIVENPIKMDDLGVPLFLETHKWIPDFWLNWLSPWALWSLR